MPRSSTWCSAVLNCSVARFLSAEWKWREEAGLQQYTKSPLLYFLSSHFFFFNDGNWSPVFVQQKNSFKWLKTQKTQTYQIKSKTILESIVLPFCLMPPPSPSPPSSSVWFELGILGTKVCQSSPNQRSGFQFNCFCLDGGRLLVLGLILVRSGAVRSGSDAGELVPEAGRQDALHLLHDEVQRSKERAEELQGDKETETLTCLTSVPLRAECWISRVQHPSKVTSFKITIS